VVDGVDGGGIFCVLVFFVCWYSLCVSLLCVLVFFVCWYFLCVGILCGLVFCVCWYFLCVGILSVGSVVVLVSGVIVW